MRFQRVRIEKLSIHEAPERISSDDLDAALSDTYKRLGIPSKCLSTLTGVVARRFWPKDVEVADAGAAVARKVLEGIDTSTLGAVINTSVSKEYLEPSVAALIHGDLGLPPQTLNFDIANACLGFLTGMNVGAQLLETGQMKRVLIVAAESARHVVEKTVERLNRTAESQDDYKSNIPTLTLGSGAVAVVLARDDVTDVPHQLTGMVTQAATQHNRVCIGAHDWMTTDAPRLLEAGVELARDVYQTAKQTFNWSPENVDSYVCHQVGAPHLAAVTRTLEIPIERAVITYPEFGNMGAAALPFALETARTQGTLNKNSRVALMGVGSGLNCAMAEVVW